MSPEEKKALALKLNEQYKAEFGESLLPEESQSLGAKALRGTAKGLDYFRGLLAAGVTAPVAEAISGKEITAPGTFAKVAKGEAFAPSSADILERLGVEAGPALSEALPGLYSETGEGLALQKGGWADPTARGAAGLALDIATDPTTYIAPGISRLAKGSSEAAKSAAERLALEVAKDSPEELLKKLGKELTSARAKNIALQTANVAVNPFEVATTALGRGVYQGPFLSADVAAAERGAKPLSSAAWKKNIWGTRKGMEKQFGKQAEEALATRGAILDTVGQNVEGIDYNRAFSKAAKIADDVEKAGELSAAKDIRTMANEYKEAGEELMGAGVPEWSQVVETQKQLLSEKLPDSAYKSSGRAKGPIQQARKSMAGGLKKEIELAAEAAIPGGGQALRESNDLLRTLLSSKKAREVVARVEGRRPRLTQLEKYGTLGTALASDQPMKGAAFFGLKKIADLLGGPAITSGVGIGMKSAAQAPLYDELLKRSLINNEMEKVSPWRLMESGQ